MTNAKYTDEEINEFLGLAQEVGITRAKRELGYPNSWATAQRWAKMRGIEVAIDELKAKASEARDWYKDEEVKMLAQEAFNRVYQELVDNDSLTADEQKKLAEAGQKWYSVWANVQGKANNINENREVDSFDANIQALIEEVRAENNAKKENVIE